jgi:hypothetical protein
MRILNRIIRAACGAAAVVLACAVLDTPVSVAALLPVAAVAFVLS